MSHYVSLRYTEWWFGTCMYCTVISTIKLVNTPITSHDYLLVCLWWELLSTTLLTTCKDAIQYLFSRSNTVFIFPNRSFMCPFCGIIHILECCTSYILSFFKTQWWGPQCFLVCDVFFSSLSVLLFWFFFNT